MCFYFEVNWVMVPHKMEKPGAATFFFPKFEFCENVFCMSQPQWFELKALTQMSQCHMDSWDVNPNNLKFSFSKIWGLKALVASLHIIFFV